MKINLYYAHEIAEMFGSKHNVKKCVLEYADKFYKMVHVERFDVRTIKMLSIVPRGEPSKVVITLESAEFTDSPVKEIKENKNSSSYQLIRHIQSFYSAFLTENGNVFSMVDQCVGFCDSVYALAMYILEYTRGNKDLDNFTVDCGNSLAGDLVFYIQLK